MSYGQRHAEHTELERSVLKLFHTQPDKLLVRYTLAEALSDCGGGQSGSEARVVFTHHLTRNIMGKVESRLSRYCRLSMA
jgi:hypothetical protein